jgi:phosphoribosylglycinamide formyltransferase-1
MPYKIAILASGNGSNAENIAKHFANSELARVEMVLTNKRDAAVVQRMQPLGIDTFYVPNDAWDNDPNSIVQFLKSRNVDLVVLAGFMHYLAKEILDGFPGMVLNIHPSLLPAYGGKGMWGHHVHEAVIAAGETESGATVHKVSEEMDHGEIVMSRKVSVLPNDTAQTLEAKIHDVEYELYPEAIEKVLNSLQSPEQQWANVLHMDYDKEEAEQRAMKAATPPAFNPTREENESQTPNNDYTPQIPLSESFRINNGNKPVPEVPKMPNTYLLGAVLCIVFCFTIFGIIALIYSIQVSNHYYRGEYDRAEKSSHRAQNWIIASFALGVMVNTLYIPFYIISTMMSGAL